MNLTYDYFSSVITVERTSLPLVSSDPYEVREFDVEEMHSILRAAEASETGIVYKDTHNWSAAKFIGGVDLAPVHEMINGYSVTFEPGIYAVKLKGANNNVVDVMNINTVSTQTSNSAGLIKVNTGGGGDGGVDHTDQLNTIEGKIDNIQGDTTTIINQGVEVDLTPVTNQLTTVEGKVDDVLLDTASIEGKVDQLSTDIGNIPTTDLSGLETKIDVIDANVDTGLVNQATIESKIDALDPSGGDYTAQLNSIESKIDTVDTNVDTGLVNQTRIEGKIDALDPSGGDYTAQLNSIEGKVDTGLTNQATIESKIDAIDLELDGLNVEVDLTPVTNQLTSIEGKVDSLVQVTARIETKVDNIVATLTVISGNFDDIPAEVWAYTGP